MTPPFNPDDVLTIVSSECKRGRQYTVVESNAHRTILRGPRGARRVLVLTGVDRLGAGYSIHEDDGEKNRGRPCTVEQTEHAPVGGPMARVEVESTQLLKHYPITAMDLARLVRCEDAAELAGWIVDREIARAMGGDRHAGDTVAAMKIYRATADLRRDSAARQESRR